MGRRKKRSENYENLYRGGAKIHSENKIFFSCPFQKNKTPQQLSENYHVATHEYHVPLTRPFPDPHVHT
jgi:hypothetical protein